MKPLLLALFLPIVGLAQSDECTIADYQRMVEEAQQFVKIQRYDKADLKLRAARVCQPGMALAVDSMLVDVRKAIVRQSLASQNAVLAIQTEKEDPTLALNMARRNNEDNPENPVAVETFNGILSNGGNTYCQKTFVGHENVVFNAQFLRDGAHIASASMDGTVRVWDFEGREIAKIGDGNVVMIGLATSPVADLILTSDANGDIRLWDENGQLVRAFNKKHRNGATALAFSPDGKSFVSGGADGQTIHWQTDGSTVKVLNEDDPGISTVDFSPDGKSVVVGKKNGFFYQYSLTGKVISSGQHRSAVTTVAFSPDGKWIATGSRDSTVRLWPAKGGAGKTILNYGDEVNWVSFSPDGEKLVSAGSDKACRVTSVDGKRLTALLGHINRLILCAVFTRDGRHVLTASADRTVKLWGMNNRLLVFEKGYEGGITDLVFDQNEPFLTVKLADGKSDSIPTKAFDRFEPNENFKLEDMEVMMGDLSKKMDAYRKILPELVRLADSMSIYNGRDNVRAAELTSDKFFNSLPTDPITAFQFLTVGKLYLFGHMSGKITLQDSRFRMVFSAEDGFSEIKRPLAVSLRQRLFAVTDGRSVGIYQEPDAFFRNNCEQASSAQLESAGYKSPEN